MMRSTANQSTGVAGAAAAAAGAGKSRPAFRDVSNTNRNGAGKIKKEVAKRPSGVKPRSSVPNERNANLNRQVTLANSTNASSNSNNNNAMDDRDAESTVREHKNLRRAQSKADPLSYQMTGTLDDIDERDHDDPLCATTYVESMYNHFREKELTTSVRPTFMETQKHINERMRAILVDWLVEVHLKFKLVPETLYLTVNMIDRYLDAVEVCRPKLQLVGVTCLLIASKYEEIYPPELRDLVYICDRAYTKQDIIEMEETILKTLDYNVTIPSAHVFLVRFLKAGHADKKIVQLSCFILDGTLQSYNLLQYLPSQLAAAAVFLSRRACGRNAWSPTLLHYAQYCEEEIIPVAQAILSEKTDASSELRAVTKKYTSQRYGGVANQVFSTDF